MGLPPREEAHQRIPLIAETDGKRNQRKEEEGLRTCGAVAQQSYQMTSRRQGQDEI